MSVVSLHHGEGYTFAPLASTFWDQKKGNDGMKRKQFGPNHLKPKYYILKRKIIKKEK